MPARVALAEPAASYVGGSQERTLILHLRSNNPNAGTLEEGFGLPGLPQLFSFTQHSTICLRTSRCRAGGMGVVALS